MRTILGMILFFVIFTAIDDYFYAWAEEVRQESIDNSLIQKAESDMAHGPNHSTSSGPDSGGSLAGWTSSAGTLAGSRFCFWSIE